MILTDVEELLYNLPDRLPYKSSVRRVLLQAKTIEVSGIEHAHWIKRDDTDKGFAFLCSSCGGTAYARPNTRGVNVRIECTYRFCPHCGAKMDGESE